MTFNLPPIFTWSLFTINEKRFPKNWDTSAMRQYSLQSTCAVHPLFFFFFNQCSIFHVKLLYVAWIYHWTLYAFSIKILGKRQLQQQKQKQKQRKEKNEDDAKRAVQCSATQCSLVQCDAVCLTWDSIYKVYRKLRWIILNYMVWFCHKLKDSGQAKHKKVHTHIHISKGAASAKKIRIEWKGLDKINAECAVNTSAHCIELRAIGLIVMSIQLW